MCKTIHFPLQCSETEFFTKVEVPMKSSTKLYSSRSEVGAGAGKTMDDSGAVGSGSETIIS